MMQMMDSAFRPYYKPMMFNHVTTNGEDQEEQGKSYSEDSLLSSSTPGKERIRRKRTTFTPEQATTLEMEYVHDRYMDRSKRMILADRLSLNENQVKTWFQNRRAKDKKEGKKMEDPNRSLESASCSTAESTPVNSHVKRLSTESPNSSSHHSGSTSALVAALNSPAPSRQTSPADLPPTPPCHMVPSPPPTAAVSAAGMLPTAALLGGVSYADYLSSFGINPLASITTPTPYPSVYDLYANYNELQSQQGKPAVLTSMLDPSFFAMPTQNRDLAQL